MNNTKFISKKILYILVVMAVVLTSIDFVKLTGYKDIEAEVVDIKHLTTRKNRKGNYYETLEYYYNGHKYVNTRKIAKGKHAVGEKVGIKINPKNPKKIYNKMVTILILIFDINVILLALGFKKEKQKC